MVADLETPEPEMTDEDWLNDPETIESLNAWHDERDAEFWNDPEAVREYEAWLEKESRIADETAEFDALCEVFDPEAYELASLGIGAGHYIAGHDAVWQDGSQV